MIDYYFNYISSGYSFNMLQRIKETLGFYPIQTANTELDGITRTVVSFESGLTLGQFVELDALMTGNPPPTFPPIPSGTRFVIDDIWEKLAAFNLSANTNLKLYFSQSLPPTGAIDQIELHSPTVLTTNQKNTVRNRFAAVIR